MSPERSLQGFYSLFGFAVWSLAILIFWNLTSAHLRPQVSTSQPHSPPTSLIEDLKGLDLLEGMNVDAKADEEGDHSPESHRSPRRASLSTR